MNDGRSGIGNGATTNPPTAQPVRLIPTSAGIALRPHGSPSPVAPPPPLPTRAPANGDPLELVDDEKPVSAEPPKSKIHQMSAAGGVVPHDYKRPTHYNKTGAVRMRTFHCRLSEQGV